MNVLNSSCKLSFSAESFWFTIFMQQCESGQIKDNVQSWCPHGLNALLIEIASNNVEKMCKCVGCIIFYVHLGQ